MPTGYDLLEHSSALRRHWLRRIVAAVIDALILFIPIRIALSHVVVPYKDIFAGVLAGVAWFVYSGVLEGVYAKTIGKKLLSLKVIPVKDGEELSLSKTFIRSVPKIFWYIFLPLDVLVGLAIEGDPRQRWSDTVAGTSVIVFSPEVKKIMNVASKQKRLIGWLRAK
ncbi:MAG: RDD family protein [Methanomassiliicoccales archaeon]